VQFYIAKARLMMRGFIAVVYLLYVTTIAVYSSVLATQACSNIFNKETRKGAVNEALTHNIGCEDYKLLW
jgi:hypothetical protein